MSLKDDIKKAMMYEGYEDRVMDIAKLVNMKQDEVQKLMKKVKFKDYITLVKALRNQDVNSALEALGVASEAYNMGGTKSPSEMRADKAAQQQAAAQVQADQEMVDLQPTDQQAQQQRTQAMQRLGRDNLGGATAQQVAKAIGTAAQAKPLTPIERKALANQASQVDALASDPKTATQFRQLLNRLNSGR